VWLKTAPRLGIGALVLALLLGCGVVAGALGGASTTGERAPNFELTTLQGQRLALTDLAGKPVVLNFWASWCAPCRAEMPVFEKTYRAYEDRGVVFVGAAVEDDVMSASEFARHLGITYPLGLDEGGTIARDYRLLGLPGTMFISRDGTLMRRWSGVLDKRQLSQFVEEIVR
jgi:peroxiredoxin